MDLCLEKAYKRPLYLLLTFTLYKMDNVPIVTDQDDWCTVGLCPSPPIFEISCVLGSCLSWLKKGQSEPPWGSVVKPTKPNLVRQTYWLNRQDSCACRRQAFAALAGNIWLEKCDHSFLPIKQEKEVAGMYVCTYSTNIQQCTTSPSSSKVLTEIYVQTTKPLNPAWDLTLNCERRKNSSVNDPIIHSSLG